MKREFSRYCDFGCQRLHSQTIQQTKTRFLSLQFINYSACPRLYAGFVCAFASNDNPDSNEQLPHLPIMTMGSI